MIDRQHGREALLISLRGLGRITICGQDFKFKQCALTDLAHVYKVYTLWNCFGKSLIQL